jgi:CheY-like chemotaxis protein
MYVDDEEALVFVMTRLLKHLGYRCTGFSDAEAALQEFRANPQAFAAVVTDLAMPNMNGLALTRALRELRADLPVAIASGYEGADVDAADRAGILRIPKPVSVDALSQALRKLLS